MDWQLLLVIGFIVLAPAGLVCAGLALYQHLRSEAPVELARMPFAMTIFALQYVLAITFAASLKYSLLLPTILMFLIAIALIIVIWLGLQARSKAGLRIAVASFFTMCAYACLFIGVNLRYSRFLR